MKTIYQRIMKTAKRGTGMRLTSEDVLALARNQCISQSAWNDDEEEEQESQSNKKSAP